MYRAEIGFQFKESQGGLWRGCIPVFERRRLSSLDIARKWTNTRPVSISSHVPSYFADILMGKSSALFTEAYDLKASPMSFRFLAHCLALAFRPSCARNQME